MSKDSDYRQHHPRWYRPRMSTYWWLERGAYLAFILRELSSIFVAWFVVYLLMLLHAVSQGDASYQAFLGWSGATGILLSNITGLLFVVFHAITWFNLAPQAMVMRFRQRRVPGALIAASNYGAWVVVSACVAWILLAG